MKTDQPYVTTTEHFEAHPELEVTVFYDYEPSDPDVGIFSDRVIVTAAEIDGEDLLNEFPQDEVVRWEEKILEALHEDDR